MKKYFGFLICILATSCFPDFKQDIKDSDYYYILEQETPNKKYKIYNYCRSGMMAFSGDICGIQIQKSDTKFEERSGIQINGRISKWISNDTLEIFRFKSNADLKLPKDTLSVITYEKAYNLTLKVLNYDKITGGGMNEYFFDEIKIDSKKIELYGIKRELGPIIGDSIEYALGNIEIISKQDTITEICVKRIKTGMNGQYRNHDGSVTENLPEIMTKSIRFYPTKRILTSELKNKVGIFYNIKNSIDNNGFDN